MTDEQLRELLDRFLTDGDHAAFEDLHAAVRPLIASVCRGGLAGEEAVDDAVQETFIRLVQRGHTIRGSITAWLTTTARNAARDRIRRNMAEGRRRRGLAEITARHSDAPLKAPSATAGLEQAMRLLSDEARQLVQERFIEGRKLHELSCEGGPSIAARSRRVARALKELAQIFEEMGETDSDVAAQQISRRGEGLAFGMWDKRPRIDRPTAPGWTRPIRVGVLLSYFCHQVVLPDQSRLSVPWQCRGIHLALNPRFDFVSLVEPGTSDQPVIERHVRDLDLDDGILDATDAAALRTLDVIWFGRQWRVMPRVAAALREAVESGVGLFSDGDKQLSMDDPNVQALLLARSRPHLCCTLPTHGRHYAPMPATICDEHPALPGLRRGMPCEADGCTTWVELAPGAKAIARFESLGPGTCSCDFCARHGQAIMANPPLLAAAGEIGRGRAMVFYNNQIEWLLSPGMIRTRFLSGWQRRKKAERFAAGLRPGAPSSPTRAAGP